MGISPVIAAVVLIAVTLAVAGVAAGFIFGIFGTQTTAANVSVVSTSLSGTTLTVIFKNTGSLADKVTAVEGLGGARTATLPTDPSVPANVASHTLTFTLSAGYDAGQTISLRLRLASGVTIPVSITAG